MSASLSDRPTRGAPPPTSELVLGGRTAPDHDDVVDQARAIHRQVLRDLEAADLRPAHVVAVTEYVVADAVAQIPALGEVRRQAYPDARPAVSTVVVPALPQPGSSISVEVVLSAASGETAEAGDGTAAARRAGDVVRLRSCLPLDDAGRIVALGDLVGQTERVYEVAADALGRLGWSLADVVKTVEFVVPHVRAAYPRTGRVRRAHLAAPYGGATGIVMDRLLHPDALIQIEFVAARGTREVVDCGWERYRTLTYNPGLRVGDTLWMSGQAALDLTTERAVLAGDVVAQAEHTFRNIRAVLEHAGLGPDALTRSVEYVTPDGLARYPEIADVRARVFPGARPAVTAVACSGLLRPEFLIEIDPTARFADLGP